MIMCCVKDIKIENEELQGDMRKGVLDPAHIVVG